MKNLSEYLTEALANESENAKIKELEKKLDKVEDKAEDAAKDADAANKEADKAKKEATKAEETITSEEDFKEYAKKKFEDVFGDDLDEDEMNKVVDGILKKCKQDIEDGDFGTAIGMLNKSFGA